jgi:hypothetical protein
MEKKMPDPEKAVATVATSTDNADALARLLTQVLTRVQRDGAFPTVQLGDKAEEAVIRYQIASAALNPQPRDSNNPVATASRAS